MFLLLLLLLTMMMMMMMMMPADVMSLQLTVRRPTTIVQLSNGRCRPVHEPLQ